LSGGGRGKCRACASDRLEDIDADLVAEVPFRVLERRYGISTASLVRHKQNHLSPALVAIRRARLAASEGGVAANLEGLIETGESILHAARKAKNAHQGLAALRELRQLVELQMRMTGELDEIGRAHV
jgi:hypothetical protein